MIIHALNPYSLFVPCVVFICIFSFVADRSGISHLRKRELSETEKQICRLFAECGQYVCEGILPSLAKVVRGQTTISCVV